MQPVFERAKARPARVVYAEGEDERVLRAVQSLVDGELAHPILVGRRGVIERRVRELGLRMDLHESVRLLDPALDEALFAPLVERYQKLVARRGVPPEAAARRVRTRPTVAAAMLVEAGEADAAICGGSGDWWRHMQYILQIIPKRPGVSRIYALSCLILPAGVLFLCDTHMNLEPTAEQLAEMTLLAADAVSAFGVAPKAALLSHSSFGSSHSPSARRMRQALALIRERAPALEIDGEMHGDAALAETIRHRLVPDSPLAGAANLLIMPGLDAAHIAFTLLKTAADGLPIGPLLLGTAKPVHVVSPSVTARGILNISALAALESQAPVRRG
jgi:malate dehydrogenase (oxaloacetate-decarboxylating)(NADP+)